MKNQVWAECPQCGKNFKAYSYRFKEAENVCCSRECGNTFKRQEPEMRFWSKVNKTDGCWLWTGTIGKHGYGTFTDEKGWPCRAHRYSWMLRYGDIPADTLICHTCDVRPCVRWDHLFHGTCRDNLQDAASKKRMAWGERHGMSLLSQEQVAEIRQLRANGKLLREIAAQFAVSVSNISLIARAESWRHLQGPHPAVEHGAVTDS